MTIKIQASISIASFFICLFCNHQIVLGKQIKLFFDDKDESSIKLKSNFNQADLRYKKTNIEKLKAKLKDFVSEENNQSTEKQHSLQNSFHNFLYSPQKITNQEELIYSLVDYFITTKELTDKYSILSNKKSFTTISTVRELAQERKVKPLNKSDLNSDYIIAPRIASPEKISPFTTTLSLNNVPISHLTDWELYSGTNFGDNINTSISGGGIFKLNGQIIESLTKNNVYTVDQQASYLQLQTIRESRKVEVTRNEPQTLMGMQMQMSLTASCLISDNSTQIYDDTQCTYTPGIVTDRNSLDPDFLTPTRIVQTANMGDVVTPESQTVMKLPGFQTGANGQQVGLDLYFPNTGAIPGNSQGNEFFYERKENIEDTQLGLYSQVRQIVKANHNKAVIGRTIRGFGLIVDNDNLLLNSAIQLGNFILPDVNPRLDGGDKKVNVNINKNLFLAANNVRIPSSSYTLYQAGIGYADSLKVGIKHHSQIPKANFNSLWIGLSPIIERRIERISRYQPTSEQRILSEGGGEGGAESNISMLSVVNGENFSSNELEDFYAQMYLTNYSQDVNFVNGSRYIEDIKYYPHISFTGNITGSLDSLKYYTGVITGETIKAYVGADYTRITSGGLNFSTGAIGYINPDRDYYSQLFSNISQTIRLGKKANFVLSSGFNYALDRENRIGTIESEAPASFVTLGAKANFGAVSLGLVNYFDSILPSSLENTLLLDLAINFSQNFRLTGYYTPINETSSRSRYGATAKLRLGNKYNSPTLSVSWTNNDYDLGQDSNGNIITFTDNIFKVLLRFGAPGNPFNQVNHKRRLQRKRNNLINQLRRGRK